MVAFITTSRQHQGESALVWQHESTAVPAWCRPHYDTNCVDQGWKHLFDKIVKDYPAVQLNGWKLWPAAAMFNYRYVPLNLRVLFLNIVALGWCAPAACCVGDVSF